MSIHIGYVSEVGRGATDAVLTEVEALLRAKGVRMAGAVQCNIERSDRAYCDMDVRVLPDGPSFRISQDLGEHAEGCRLDPTSLEKAVMEATLRLEGAEVLIINKFGKLEAEGRGFCALIAEAVARNMTILVGVNGLNHFAFKKFAGDLAIHVGGNAQEICEWVKSRRRLKAA